MTNEGRKRVAVGVAWTAMKVAAENYCEAYAALSDGESRIGDDGYADEYMADILNALIKLLSCETGKLDGGTEDRAVRAIAEKAGLLNDRGDITPE